MGYACGFIECVYFTLNNKARANFFFFPQLNFSFEKSDYLTSDCRHDACIARLVVQLLHDVTLQAWGYFPSWIQ